MTSLSSEFSPWNLLFLSLETGNKNFQRTNVTHISACARHGEDESYLSMRGNEPFVCSKKTCPLHVCVSFFIAQYFVEVGRSKG